MSQGVPGSIHLPVRGGWLDSRIPEIAAELHRRDPRLSLLARCNSSRQVECYDLFEKTPDGQEHWVARWGPHEVSQILTDVQVMRQDSPSHVPFNQRISRNNDAKRDKALREAADATAEMAERVEAVKRDTFGRVARHLQPIKQRKDDT